MRRESITVTIEFSMFDVGEQVRPLSRSGLTDGVYIVRECLRPIGVGGSESSVVFLEGEQYGHDGAYLLPVDHEAFYCYDCGKHIPIGALGHGLCPDCQHAMRGN